MSLVAANLLPLEASCAAAAATAAAVAGFAALQLRRLDFDRILPPAAVWTASEALNYTRMCNNSHALSESGPINSWGCGNVISLCNSFINPPKASQVKAPSSQDANCHANQYHAHMCKGALPHPSFAYLLQHAACCRPCFIWPVPAPSSCCCCCCCSC